MKIPIVPNPNRFIRIIDVPGGIKLDFKPGDLVTMITTGEKAIVLSDMEDGELTIRRASSSDNGTITHVETDVCAFEIEYVDAHYDRLYKDHLKQAQMERQLSHELQAQSDMPAAPKQRVN